MTTSRHSFAYCHTYIISMIHNIRGHTIVLSATVKRASLTFRLVIVNYLTSVYVPSPPVCESDVWMWGDESGE